MAQVGSHRAGSREGAEEEAGRASAGSRGCWSPVCMRQGIPEKQEPSICCKTQRALARLTGMAGGQREDVLMYQTPRGPGVRCNR